LNASDIHLQGLAIVGSTESGIFITNYDTPDSIDIKDIEVANNWVGVNLQGEIVSNTVYGIRVVKYPPGGSRSVNDTLIQENVLSGNGDDGLYLQDVPSTTHVLSNIIGLDPTGTVTSPNGGDGISIIARGIPTTATTIRGNIISGNARHGIFLDEAQGVMMAGNKIGTNITGTQGLGNGKDGIQVNDSDHNVIGGSDPASRNIIAGNARAGVFVSGADAQYNLIQNNYIGTGQSGTEVIGNGESGDSINDDGDGGVYIQDGAAYNEVRDNLIRFNYIGVRFSGGEPLPADPIDPPQHNQVISNTIIQNNKYGITNKSTHRNTAPYTTPPTGDNLIQGNVITGTGQACGVSDTWCTGIGIYNYGASPQISNNRIEENEDYGISNSVHFWTDGASNASDDLLSMPEIVGNTIANNQNGGIRSRDTAPMNKSTLLSANTFIDNLGLREPHISQRWYVAAEVISGTDMIDGANNITVTITRQDDSTEACYADCIGTHFDAVDANDGIWGPQGVDYDDVDQKIAGNRETSWFEVIEYEVGWRTPLTYTWYTSHLVQVKGDYMGSRYFSFDGVTTTHEISGLDQTNHLPFCITTGILDNPQHTLCRYQIAQIAAFGDGDADGDGISDQDEGTGDHDGDGVPDYQDEDADGDGILDEVEGDEDTDNDGVPDYLDEDSDGDGIPDEVEGTVDTDGDGVPDYKDDDSDGDGIPDETEGTTDTDGDGIPDYLEHNDDDIDGDGDPNYDDIDSDGDGISDDDEYYGGEGDDAFCADTTQDTDGDGTPDCQDNDVDGDGIANYLDGDSDGDGIPDDEEGKDDSDGDGIPDWLDPADGSDPSQGGDSDGDGISDDDEYYDGSDGDAFCDDDSQDMDGDGIPDCEDNDADGDGTPNYLDDDSDDDGILDETEGTDDSDGDGIPDYLDTDSDGDGIPDETEGTVDTDGDGTPDYLDEDSDGDSIPDETEGTVDTDGDGIPDYLEDNFDDIDGDGNPNYDDTDSDGDGIPDDDEYYDGSEGDSTFCTDNSQDTDGDDIPDCRDNDVDGDGILNYLDGDSDGDGTPDTDEYDADGDGTPDDTDGDGIPDWLDPADGTDPSDGGDSDGDGISDVDEAGDNPADPDDADNDGIPDYLDTIENIQSGDVTLEGPTTGKVGVGATFTATVAITPTAPFTYVWTTPAGTFTYGPLTARVNTFIFTGTMTGTHPITVTVINGRGNNSGQASDSQTITLSPSAVALTGVSVTGPVTGSVLFSHIFTATFQPPEAAPVTFGWTATGDPTSAISETDTFTLTWSTGGTYTITATASNPAGEKSGSHQIKITDDTDGDGILDVDEYTTDTFCTDTDVDSDKDGTPNCQDNDVDGDGVPNYLDEDSDGDGIPDAEEGTADDDGDSIPNFLDPHYYIYLPVLSRKD
jgi:hypothetical protein